MMGKSNKNIRLETSNISAALELLDDDVNINRAWGSIRENIKALATDSLGHCKVESASIMA
jgi:hypothetical protein